MALIFTLSSFPRLPKPPGALGFDKFEHFAAYGCLAFLAARAIRHIRQLWKPLTVVLTAVAIAAAFGATDEFHQRFVPNRTCDVFDWTADLTGAIIGAVLLCVVVALMRRRSQTQNLELRT
jgi:VanZ family protein